MSIFVAFRVNDAARFEAALRVHFPGDYLAVQDDEYLISAVGSAKEVCDKLKVTDGSLGPVIVFKMSNYFGRAPTDIWDWIKTKAEAAGG